MAEEEDKTLKKVSEKLDEGIKKFEKPASKFDAAATDLQNLFRGFDTKTLEAVAQNSMGMQNSLDMFLDARRDSIAGFGDSMNGAFRETQKWADRTTFDIQTMAEQNIRTMREGIEKFEPMATEMGTMLETRVIELSKELMTADMEKARMIRGEILAIKKSASKLDKKEAERLDFISSSIDEGFGEVTGFTGVLKDEIKKALPSLDKFAENILGGGILGKSVGMLIRTRKKSKEAKASVAGRMENAEQQEAVNESDRYQAALAKGTAVNYDTGEMITDEEVEAQQDISGQSVVDELRELNKNVVDGLGVRSPGYLHDMLSSMKDDAGDEKEGAGEEQRLAERHHDEMIAAMGGGDAEGGAESGGGGGFLAAIAGTGKALGKGIQGLLTGIAKGIGAFGGGKVFKGIIAIGLLGVALVPFAFGLKQFTDISFPDLLKGAGALVVFAVAAGIMGKLGSHIIMGAVAIGILGVALIPFAYALSMFGDVSWSDVFIGLGALAAFAVVAGLIGLALPFVLAGSLGIAALGAALIPAAIAMVIFGAAAVVFGVGLTLIGEALHLIVGAVGDFLTNIVDNFIRLGEMGGAGMLSAAVGITALAVALVAFTAAGAAAQLLATASSVASSAMAFLFGTPAPGPFEMLTMFTAFGQVAPLMSQGAAGIDELTGAIGRFAAAEFDNESVAQTIALVAGLGGAVKAFMGNQPGLLEGIGSLVGGAIGAVGGWFSGLLGIEEDPVMNPLQVLENLAKITPQLAVLGPALTELSSGMMKILAFQDATFPSRFFDDLFSSIGTAPVKAFDAQTKAINKFADAVANLTGEMRELIELGPVEAGGRFVMAQDSNLDLKNKVNESRILQSLEGGEGTKGMNMMNNQNVVNNTTNVMDINARNTDMSLNGLMARRR